MPSSTCVGGTINNNLILKDEAIADIYLGTLGTFTTKGKSQARLFNGLFNKDMTITEDSKLIVANGNISGDITLSDDAYLDIRGGFVLSRINLTDSSTMAVYGGTMAGNMVQSMSADSTLSIIGFDFKLDGVAIDGLELNKSTLIDYAGKGELTGRLSDNKFFMVTLDEDILGNIVLTADRTTCPRTRIPRTAHPRPHRRVRKTFRRKA